MKYKVVYDFSKPRWQTFGHTVFVEAAGRCQAEATAQAAIHEREGPVTVTRVEITAATEDQYRRHQARVVRQRQWVINTTRGVPNPRTLL